MKHLLTLVKVATWALAFGLRANLIRAEEFDPRQIELFEKRIRPLIGPKTLALRAAQERRLTEVAAKLAELDRQHRFQELTVGGRSLVPVAFQSDVGAMGRIATTD